MAAISPNTVTRASMGDTTLLICGMTATSVSDTWTPASVIPVVDYWTQAQGGLGINEPDTSYNPTTGVFTFNSGTTSGPMTLYVMAAT